MPLYDFLCSACEKTSEILMTSTDDAPVCQFCGSKNLEKLLSAHAGISGIRKNSMPGPQDTACCGSSPGHDGCAGPGSCCGKGPL